MRVLVGSKNPVKIEAVRDAFSRYFDEMEVISRGVDANVPKMPKNEEIFIGAKNRVLALKEINERENLEADFFVGVEAGMHKLHEDWFTFNGVCIMNNQGKLGYGTSTHFQLPKNFVPKLLGGEELGDLMDAHTRTNNTKQKGGAIGFFSKDVLNRKKISTDGVIVALIPFLNEEIFFR